MSSTRQPGGNLHPRTDELSWYSAGSCGGCVELCLSCGLLGLLRRLLGLLDLLLLQGSTGLEGLHLQLLLLLLTQGVDGDVLSGRHLSGQRLRHHAGLLLRLWLLLL